VAAAPDPYRSYRRGVADTTADMDAAKQEDWRLDMQGLWKITDVH